MSRRALLPLLALVAMTFSSTAHADNEHVSLVVNGQVREFVVEPGNYWGLSANLTRYGNEMRGWYQGRALDVSLAGQSVKGLFAGVPLDLYVDKQATATKIHGSIGAGFVELTATADTLEGVVNSCAYQLHRVSDTDFQGTSTCSRTLMPTSLHIPATLLSRGADERSLVLALLLN